MLRGLILGLVTSLGLLACSQGEDNADRNGDGIPDTPIAQDSRRPVARITSLKIERTPTGAIVHAIGLPPTQGWFDASLVPQSEEPINGEMVYVFRAQEPAGPQRISTVQSRELHVARPLSSQDFAATRRVRVIGATNALVASR